MLRHCAEAVVSLADSSNVVGEVASQLGDLVARWTQSASTDFDALIAMTIPAEWARIHQPVISTEDGCHTLYTRFQPSHPGGKRVLCGSGCQAPLRAKPRPGVVRITCTKCKSRCSVKLERLDRQTVLGQHDLIRVEWPPVQYVVGWEVCEEPGLDSDWSNAGDDGGDDGDDSHDGEPKATATTAKSPAMIYPKPQPPPRPERPPPRPLPPPSRRAAATTTTATTTAMVATAATQATVLPRQKSAVTLRVPPRPPSPIARTNSDPTPNKRQRTGAASLRDTYAMKMQNRGGKR